jgi:hypothetical protein
MPLVAAPQSAELRWKFIAGNRYDVWMEQVTGLETEVDLVKQTVQTESEFRFEWKVTDIDPKGAAQIEMVIRSVRLKVVMPLTTGLRTLEVDTEVPVDGEPTLQAEVRQNLQAIVGAPIRIRIDAGGRLLEIALSDETKDALRQAPQSMQVRQLLTEEGLQELLASAAPVLPEDSVAVGDSWSIERDVINPAGRFLRKQTLTWASNEQKENREQARIDVVSSLEPSAPNKGPDPGNAESARLTIREQKSGGSLWFDADRGMFTSGSIHSELVTAAPYREKQIVTRVQSQVEIRIQQTD